MKEKQNVTLTDRLTYSMSFVALKIHLQCLIPPVQLQEILSLWLKVWCVLAPWLNQLDVYSIWLISLILPRCLCLFISLCHYVSVPLSICLSVYALISPHCEVDLLPW